MLFILIPRSLEYGFQLLLLLVCCVSFDGEGNVNSRFHVMVWSCGLWAAHAAWRVGVGLALVLPLSYSSNAALIGNYVNKQRFISVLVRNLGLLFFFLFLSAVVERKWNTNSYFFSS